MIYSLSTSYRHICIQVGPNKALIGRTYFVLDTRVHGNGLWKIRTHKAYIYAQLPGWNCSVLPLEPSLFFFLAARLGRRCCVRTCNVCLHRYLLSRENIATYASITQVSLLIQGPVEPWSLAKEFFLFFCHYSIRPKQRNKITRAMSVLVLSLAEDSWFSLYCFS